MGLFDKLAGAGDRPGSRHGNAAPSVTAAMGYDRVHIPMPGGESKQLTREQFEALALEDRIRLLVQGTLRFFRADEEISSGEAMRAEY